MIRTLYGERQTALKNAPESGHRPRRLSVRPSASACFAWLGVPGSRWRARAPHSALRDFEYLDLKFYAMSRPYMIFNLNDIYICTFILTFTLFSFLRIFQNVSENFFTLTILTNNGPV